MTIPFQSLAPMLQQILPLLVVSPDSHAKWLNTLSFLENCGARKIAACEHPTLVKEEMLKHAAEEFRHAHHLKRQIQKIFATPMDTYALPYLLGGIKTLHYLPALDLHASRILKQRGLSPSAIKQAAYLLVTYAIERRAEELYPLYDNVLRRFCSPVTVKSILLEEQEHLADMCEGLQQLTDGHNLATQVCAIEGQLCNAWLTAIARSYGV